MFRDIRHLFDHTLYLQIRRIIRCGSTRFSAVTTGYHSSGSAISAPKVICKATRRDSNRDVQKCRIANRTPISLKSEVRGQRSEVRGRRSEVGSPRSKAGSPKPRAGSRNFYFLTPRNFPICSFKNFSSAGLPPAPAVCPHSDGIGTSETLGMNPAS